MRCPCSSLLLLVCWAGVVCSVNAQQDVPTVEQGLLPILRDTAQRNTRSLQGAEMVMVPAGAKLLVASITVVGNKKTRPNIITREVPFSPGQSYGLQELADLFETAQQQLMNTTLFHSVKVSAGQFDGNCVEVVVQVVERWYIFPFPYFKLIDRNFNQWLIDQKASLKRVNYGTKLLYNNVTGRNDRIRVWLFTGYTQQASLSYERPYFDKQLRWGYRLFMNTAKAKEINYNTIDDKQMFWRSDNQFARQFSSFGGELTYRKKLFARHQFGLTYFTEQVLDTIVQMNPDYFFGGLTRVRFPEFSYRFSYQKVDYIPYPLTGQAYRIRFTKGGWNKETRVWQLHGEAFRSWPIGADYFLSMQAYAGIKLPFTQPFFNRRFLGYGDIFLRGYEYYVIDGVAGGYLRASLTRELAEVRLPVPEVIRRKKGLTNVPIRIFARVFANSGYVHNPQPGLNQLNNKPLHAAGIGIDLLSLYDITFRFEYSFNQLGQNGLFLHRNISF
ncbi:MAG: POTRA domain-containing protein [Sphingomonadales bacterium]